MPEMSQKLTSKLVRRLCPEQNSKEVEKLHLSDKGISEIGDLSTLSSLKRLDLSKNIIQSTSFAATCTGLKWLSLANNPVSDLSPLSSLHSLQVLNVGHAKLVEKVKVGALTSLGALILNDKALTSISGLKEIKGLNTLVLKNNAFEDLGSSLHYCSGLSKLSMAHNQLSDLGDNLKGCTALKELRLKHNALTALPQSLSACRQLRIVDLAGNPISTLQSLKVLAQLPDLQNLTLKGCPVTENPKYPEDVIELLPQLHILDSQRVSSSTGVQPKQPAVKADGKQGLPQQDASASLGTVPQKSGSKLSKHGQRLEKDVAEAGDRAGAPLASAHSSKEVANSAEEAVEKAAVAKKRKHAEAVAEPHEQILHAAQHFTEQTGRKMKPSRDANHAIEAAPTNNGRALSGYFNASAQASHAANVSLPASTPNLVAPEADSSVLKGKKKKGAKQSLRAAPLSDSGAEPVSSAAASTGAAVRTEGKSCEQEKQTPAAVGHSSATAEGKASEKASNAKGLQANRKGKAGHQALASGKVAAKLLQQELDAQLVGNGTETAWAWEAPEQLQGDLPTSTWD